MSLKIGIVGLPNVGKSTLFNALTQTQQAEAANYPFCTIEPNQAIVPVPDVRLERLHGLLGVPNAIPTTIEFVDIAGLVKGASRGEGLGNKFLGQIREADALIHVVRCFDDANVVHISERPDPVNDIEIINLELALADLQQLERKIEKLERQVKGDRPTYQPLLVVAHALQEQLEAGIPVSHYPQPENAAFVSLNRELRFLTGKPVIYAANVDETQLRADNAYVTAVHTIAQEAPVVKLSAQLEAEMATMDAAERAEFMALAGIEEGGLAQVIRQGYAMLGLISFFTHNKQEVRAWTVAKGASAPQAAGVIHTDFERGFIRAEVVGYETFVAHGGQTAVKAAGALRVEGREYVVQDGDIIFFRFNV